MRNPGSRWKCAVRSRADFSLRQSRLVALGHMSGPGLAGFQLHLGEAHASGRVRDADEVVARRALDLASGELRLTLQRLVAVGAVEFEFVCVHKSQPFRAQSRGEKHVEFFHILFAAVLRM